MRVECYSALFRDCLTYAPLGAVHSALEIDDEVLWSSYLHHPYHIALAMSEVDVSSRS